MNWTALREQMPVVHRWAFFDHAAVAPLTEAARQAFHHYAADLAENGSVNEPRWIERLTAVRRLCGQLLGADPLDIAFVKNTSEGIGFVAEGFPWAPGDNVVIAAEEYPSNVYPWMNLATRGVEVRMVPSRGNRILIDDIQAHLDSRTRLVSLSFVEFASGFRNDLDRIGELCGQRNICFFVDAIQGLGVIPLDVSRTPVDFLSADGHKWLLGPEGAGIFYIRRELVDLLRPISVGWHSVVRATDFSTIDFQLKPHAGRWESGSLHVGGISALGASLELLLAIGIEAIRDRVFELTDYLCDRLTAARLEVFSSRLPGEKSGIVSVSMQNPDLRALVRSCRDQGIVINQRGGRLRISPHCYNSFEEIDRLLKVLTNDQ